MTKNRPKVIKKNCLKNAATKRKEVSSNRKHPLFRFFRPKSADLKTGLQKKNAVKNPMFLFLGVAMTAFVRENSAWFAFHQNA